MGIHADLGRALAEFADRGAPRVRVLAVDPVSGVEIRGAVTAELSETHVRLRADDGLVFAAAKADLTILPGGEG